MRSKKKEISTIKSVLDRSGSTLDTEPTEAVIAEAEALTQKALHDYEESMKSSHYAEAKETASVLLREAEDAIAAMDKAGNDWAEIKDLTPPGDRPTSKQMDVVDRIQAIRGIHQMHVDLEFSGCLVCEREGTVDHAALAQSKEEIIQGIHGLGEWWSVYDQLASAVDATCHKAVEAVNKANEAKAVLDGLNEESGDEVDYKGIWEAAHMRETALKEVAKQWKVLRSQREETRILRADISNLEEVIDGSTQAVSRLLKNAVDSFSQSVQGYLPESDVFELRLEENGKEVCRLGFNRDGFLHTALSGAEWARLTLAIACAAAEGTDGLRVFTPEERAFDPATLRDVMAALSEAPGHVLITSPIKHKGRLPKGWTVIDLADQPTKGHSTPSLDDASPSLG